MPYGIGIFSVRGLVMDYVRIAFGVVVLSNGSRRKIRYEDGFAVIRYHGYDYVLCNDNRWW